MIKKPPLGVMPRNIHLDMRITELARAIAEYTSENVNRDLQDWSDELHQLIKEKFQEPK